MNENSKFPRPVEAFLVIIVSFIFIVLVTQVLTVFFISDTKTLDKDSISFKILITFGEIGLILVPLAYVKMRRLSFKETFRWNKIPSSLMLWSFVIGLSASVLSDELDRLLNYIIPAPEFLSEIASALQINSFADFLVLFTGAVVAAAFVEESIIRGFLQSSLERYQDVTRAVIYASLAWTIIHGMLFWAIQIFLVGIVLGLLAWRSNSILPSMIGHATNNAAALFFYNINQEKIKGIYLWADHVSPLFLILALFGLVYGVKAFYSYYENTDRYVP